jgi:hypothetical protein
MSLLTKIELTSLLIFTISFCIIWIVGQVEERTKKTNDLLENVLGFFLVTSFSTCIIALIINCLISIWTA